MSDQTGQRVKLLERPEADATVHSLYDRADAAIQDGTLPGPTLFGNQVRALAHNPQLLQSLSAVYESFAATASMDRRLSELGVLIVSRVNACQYCVQHHAPLGHGAGLSQTQLQAIQDDRWSDPALWSEAEWLVVRYAAQLTRAPGRIDDTLFTALHAEFTDRQIVDMTMRFALCSAWNKFNDALGLDTESAFQHAYGEIGLTATG
ncbi:MAG: carboxymuconolactone decarboxylase family protein [Proteobacteria bacterium]|nr:carboxymuconolactone decarboxylase family protein [Pseudomonadota bacterium]